MTVARIDVDGMAALVRGLEDGVAALDGARASLRSTLGTYSLDTSRADALRHAADWGRDQLPGVRRRLALAQALEGSRPGWPAGTVELVEEDVPTMSPQEAARRGRELAIQLRDHPGVPDDDVLAELDELQHDPYFATAFTGELSAAELAEVVRTLAAQRTDDPNLDWETREQRNAWYGQVLADLSGAVATATRATGELALPPGYAQSWVDEITEDVPGSSPYYEEGEGVRDNANALTVLLNQGRFGTPFLDTVAAGVYDYERRVGEERGQVWQPRGSDLTTVYGVYDAEGRRVRDPLVGVMNALGHNPEAAQHFFSGGPTREAEIDGRQVAVSERLAYLVQERTWSVDPDEGGALGSALEAATTRLRDRGETGRTSAEIASQTFWLVGSQTNEGADGGFLGLGADDGWEMWRGMRGHVAQMLASYGADVERVVVVQGDDLTAGWSGRGSGPLFPDDMPYGAVLDRELLEKMVATIGEDQDDFAPFLAGMFQAGNLSVDTGLRRAMAEQPSAGASFLQGVKIDDASSSITNASTLVGWALDTGYGGDHADEELQKKRAEAVADALSLTSSLPFVPEIKPAWVAWGVDEAKDRTLEEIRSSAPTDSEATYTELDDQARRRLAQQTMNLLLRTGYLDEQSIAAAADAGVTVEPPPREAIVWSDTGEPLRFDTESTAYRSWLATSSLTSILAESVVGPYADQWGVLR